MSAAHVLLSSLQDRARCSAESCRAILAELLALCRYDELKGEVVDSGVETLLALAYDEALMTPDALEALLELLSSLVLGNHAARARVMQKGVLRLALDVMGSYLGKKLTKKRGKIINLALELIDQWSCSSTSNVSESEHHEVALSYVLRTLNNASEDANILLHAAEVLGCILERHVDSIEIVAQLDGVPTLLRLLLTTDEMMDVKRSVCEALLIMSDASGMIQLMAAANIIHALSTCLRAPIPGRDVEAIAMRLLLRLSDEAQVYGQIISEDMLPLLFQVVDRNCNILEVAAPACALLERLARFARDCKLDLSSYVQTAVCRGSVLIHAASCHVHVASLVLSVFRFFVNVSFNPVDLPLLINAETLEGLLALFVLNGSSGSLAALSLDLVQIVSSLSRSTIEALSLKDDDKSLPSLFLCLRTHHDNLRFASQVFAVLTKYWRTQTRSVHSITGFVGIAVDALCRYAQTNLALCDEMMDIYNFVRLMLVSKDGVEVVLSCGGRALFDALQSMLTTANLAPPPVAASPAGTLSRSESSDRRVCVREPPLSSVSSGVSKVSSALVTLLGHAVSAAPEGSAPSPVLVARCVRDGDDEYEEFVTRILRKERSCLFKTFDATALTPSGSSSSLASSLYASSSRTDVARQETQGSAHQHKRAEASDIDDGDDSTGSGDSHDDDDDGGGGCADGAPLSDQGAVDDALTAADDDEDDDAEADENDGNGDDGSDGDGSDEDVALELSALEANGNQDLAEVCENDSETVAGAVPSPKSHAKLSPPKTFAVKGWSTRVDFAQFDDKTYYYESPRGVQFPKHPSRSNPSACLLDALEDASDALDGDTSAAPEPCRVPSPEAMSAFVEQANARRAAFLQSDPASRARLVYDSKSHYESLGGASTSEHSPALTAKQPEMYPYYVSEKSNSGVSFSSSECLTFDSCFESGNLARAVQIGEFEYDLFLRRDVNTTGHMQWFYFAVSNIRTRPSGAAAAYRFNIVNLCKPDSLFNQGLQPVVYSVKDAHERRQSWRRSGSEIYYFSNPFPRSTKCPAAKAAAVVSPSASSNNNNNSNDDAPAAPVETHFTLTFTLEFANTNDTYLVAHSYPYTLTDHCAHMDRLVSDTRRSLRHTLRRSVLCKTLSGKECELLTITDFAASTQEQRARRAVVISSRVHPGEAQASWMMRGIIDFLLGDSDAARVLRRMFQFLIVPMLNPDGVYYGNSRCSLAACDLNRIWHNPSQVYHPTIFHTKELLRQTCATRGVVFFCDLHGHSRKKNVFMYGCDTKKRPNPRARAFAKLFAAQQTAKRYLSFPDCSFKISKSKETTARVVVANELKIAWCFTLEASFCGGSFGPLAGMHYTTAHMRQVGASLCETLLQACVSDGSVRERLAALVDDYSVNVAVYVDGLLRDAGVVTDGYGASATGPGRESSTATPRTKAKVAGGGGGGSSGGVRRTSDGGSSATAKGARRKSSSTKPVKPPGLSKASRQDSRKLEPKLVSDRHSSSAADPAREVSADIGSPRTYLLSSDACGHDYTSAMPARAKIGGKKLRSKKGKKKVVKRAQATTVAAHDERTTTRAESMPAIGAFATRALDSDALYSSGVRESSSSSSGSSTSSTASVGLRVLAKPSTCASSASKSPGKVYVRSGVGCLQLVDSIATILRKPAAPALPSPDALHREPGAGAAVIFPPPVSDLVAARSPKAKATSVRFRGAGRQFAVVSPVQQKSLREILRSESTQFATYDQDLLSASAMAIRQRTSTSIGNNAFPPRVTKLGAGTPPSPFLSFPSV